jgi:hypothetical protein
MSEVTLRVYGPLNDFLPEHRRQAPWQRVVDGHPSVKDVIERAGIRIAVFPRFVTFDIGPHTRVRARPLEPIRFLADVHLGKRRSVITVPRAAGAMPAAVV